MKDGLVIIRGSDMVPRNPPPLVGDQIRLAKIIEILRPDWHPNYAADIARRYMVARDVPLVDAVRAVALGYTHPAFAADCHKLSKKHRERLT